MGTIWIKEFTGGLDTRRMPETTSGGVLIVAKDGHINRGGEFEKRAAFTPTYQLPAGTVSMSRTNSSVVVFGSVAAPAMPVGVIYQRLQHPDGVTPLARVLSYDLYAGLLYAVGEFEDGSRYHFYNEVRVLDWFDGRAHVSFVVTSGDGTGQLTNIAVGGFSIINTTITWATSNVATASAVAAAVNSFTSSPDYTATASGNTVSIVAVTPGASENGKLIQFTKSGNLVLDTPGGVLLTDGVTAAGTFIPGTFVRTIGSKVYSVSGPLAHFSGIQAPTKWKTDTAGAGFIDMSTHASGSEDLTAVAEYQNYIAFFAEKTTQIWYMDSDPKLNKKSQTLRNTGTASPRSVTQFGDSDIFYLDESGLRSLRARDASNSAATTDIGVPIDSLVTEKLKSLTQIQRDQIIGLIEPGSGRFWLIMEDTIFVFSFFSGAKVSAWSTYKPGFVVEDALVFQRRVYLRSGDTIYVYGGLSDVPEYDATEAEAWLPYLDANTPAKKKQLTGVDVACEGQWRIQVAMEPTNLEATDEIARVFRSTFGEGRIPAQHAATHFSLRFKSKGIGPAKLGSAIIHYEGKADED